MTSQDMRNIQSAEHFRDRRRKALMQNAPDVEIAGLMFAEAQALLDAAGAIRSRVAREVQA